MEGDFVTGTFDLIIKSYSHNIIFYNGQLIFTRDYFKLNTMNKNLRAFCKLIFALSLLFFITSKVTAQPVITSFSPASGAIGTNVTITGTGFNAVAANNIVYFGAVKATVTSATATSLNVTVPAGATYRPLSVLNNATGLTGYSSRPFIITFTNPAGTGIPANFYKPKVDFITGVLPYSISIGDVDGDGRPDMVIANANSTTISVLRNISSTGIISGSSFAAKVDFVTNSYPRSVTIGDFDGDGKPDLVIVNQSSNNLSVLRNTSTPGVINSSSFAAKVDFITAGTPVSIAISDVDGDGKPDLISANSNATSISILHNTSTPGSTSFAAKVDFATGLTPFSIAILDVDGDGKKDLVVANAALSATSVSVLRNTSISGIINSSSFAAKVDFITGATPRCVAIGDIDGDGKPDLVIANSEPTSTTLSVLRNTSTSGSITASSFASKVDFTTGLTPYSVAIGDVDGDGKPDLVVANSAITVNSISVLRNTSAPGAIDASSFATKVDFGTGTAPVSVAIGDLDGDGIPEVAVANLNSSSASVFQIDLFALPVTLTNIKAYQQNAGVQVEWTAQQESNIDRYEVERSQNGQQFSTLGSVRAGDNVSVAVKYNLFDPNPLNGVNFYRIKIIEAGKETYSQILKVNMNNGSKNSVTIYPNPIKGSTVALEINLQKGNYTIILTNGFGQQVMNKRMTHAGGAATETLESSKSLAAGVYQLRLTGEGVDMTRQIIKN